MRLTPELVARVSRHIADPGATPHQMAPSEQQVVATVRNIVSEAVSTEAIWFFAFGSLIWSWCGDLVERRVALAHGWHRSFCLGWDTRCRGDKDAPGLML